MSKPNLFLRTLNWLWLGVDGFRKLLHLLVLLFLLLLCCIVLHCVGRCR